MRLNSIERLAAHRSETQTADDGLHGGMPRFQLPMKGVGGCGADGAVVSHEQQIPGCVAGHHLAFQEQRKQGAVGPSEGAYYTASLDDGVPERMTYEERFASVCLGSSSTGVQALQVTGHKVVRALLHGIARGTAVGDVVLCAEVHKSGAAERSGTVAWLANVPLEEHHERGA
jgi:hypothetical protein